MPDQFAATGDDTAQIAVAATTGRVLIGNIIGEVQVRVVNDTTATIFVKFGDVTVTADTGNDVPVLTKTRDIFTVPPVAGGSLYVAVIGTAASGIAYFTPGTGSL